MMALRILLLAISLAGCTFVAAPNAFANAPVVGVLAPTTGTWSAFGERVVRQVGAAAADAGGIPFAVFDTATDPAGAWHAAVDAGVRVVIGPVGELETRAVLEARGEHTLPIVVLAPVSGIERGDEGVFRARTTLGDQAEAVAALATYEDGHRRFAVAAADDAVGHEAVIAFVRGVVSSGGIVTTVAQWTIDEPRLQHTVDQLVGRRAARLASPSNPWRAPPRIRVVPTGRGATDAPDAVFVPDWSETVADLLPFLAFHEWIVDDAMATVALYGTSGWVASTLQAAGDLAVGARVIRVFAVDDPRPGPSAWADEQVLRFGEEPTEFDAQIFDAAAFVFDVLEEVPADVSDAHIADRMTSRRYYAGTTGRMRFDEHGGIVRELGWWEIDAGGGAWSIGVFTPSGLE